MFFPLSLLQAGNAGKAAALVPELEATAASIHEAAFSLSDAAETLRDFRENRNRSFANALSGLYPKTMIPVIVERSGIPGDTKVNSVTKEQRRALLELTKHFTVRISGRRPVEEAIITSGGVSVKEIDPKTMESKLVPGLYFAGEVLDVDAYTGGFNLQIAWSTACAAGTAAAAAVVSGQ